GRRAMDVIKTQYYSTNRNTLLNRNTETDEITDPELEQLLEAVASEPDHEQRIQASQAVQTYLAKNAYVIPFFEEPQVFGTQQGRSEEHTSELQSRFDLVCRLLL